MQATLKQSKSRFPVAGISIVLYSQHQKSNDCMVILWVVHFEKKQKVMLYGFLLQLWLTWLTTLAIVLIRNTLLATLLNNYNIGLDIKCFAFIWCMCACNQLYVHLISALQAIKYIVLWHGHLILICITANIYLYTIHTVIYLCGIY